MKENLLHSVLQKKGSRKWYNQKYQDAMAMSLQLGKADLFITVTGNENISEIRRLRQGRKLSNQIPLTNVTSHF